MKELVRYSFLFVVFSIAFSGLSSCTGTMDPGLPPSAANSADRPAGKSAGYPPLPSAVAQSELKNLDGTTFTVADRKGKVLLLNLWATWCGPCRAEMPALVAMHEKYNGQDFEVIGLNVSEEPKALIDDFADEMKLNYPLVWADTALQNELTNKISKFPGIPQSFLVDRNGHLRGVFKGGSPAEVKKMEASVEAVVNE